MPEKRYDDLADLSVIGVDIGKDTFHLVGFDGSPRMQTILIGLYEDWLWLDERIETVSSEITEIAAAEPNCGNVMSIPGIGPMISTAMVAAIGTGNGFDRGRDFAAWVGLVPRQYSTGGRSAGRSLTTSRGWRWSSAPAPMPAPTAAAGCAGSART